MPEWLAIVLAVLGPVAMGLGVVVSRTRTETRMVGRMDLLESNVAAVTSAITVRLDGVVKQADKASESRGELHEMVKEHSGLIRDRDTVCKLTHPDRVT